MAENRSKFALGVLAAVLVASPAFAQRLPDPANLTGEHVAPQAPADILPIDHGAAALQQLLVKLHTRASMMLIVAHPDDEDGGFLAYESRGQGARVAMLTLTRGEGGQNLMSADFDDALGLIRTQELLEEDRYTGVDQFFGTEVDFGFSKTKEESFAKWTHERVLYDAVRAVRLYRPLVLASVFVGGVTDGHGHHQVSGEICQEVFKAAADPKVFPEMGLPAWAPVKVYARVPFSRVAKEGMFDYATGKWSPPVFHNYVTGVDITHEPEATVTIHEGEKSSLIGMNGDTYLQFARRGLALQRTQIGSGTRMPQAGTFDVGYTLMGSRLAAGSGVHEQGIFDGVDVSLAGIAGLAPGAPGSLKAGLQAIEAKAVEAQKAFDPARVEASAPALRDALKEMDGLIAATEEMHLSAEGKFNVLHELRVKRVQLNRALVLALGLDATSVAEARSNSTVQVSTGVVGGEIPLTPGGLVHVQGQVAAAADPKLKLEGVSITIPALAAPAGIKRPMEAPGGYEATFVVPLRAPISKPYFSRPDLEQPYYDISDPNLRNAPETPAAMKTVVRADYEGVAVELEVTPVYPGPRDGKQELLTGNVPQRVEIAPAVGVLLEPRVTLVKPHGGDEAKLTAFATAENAAPGGLHGVMSLQAPQGWRVTAERQFPMAGGMSPAKMPAKQVAQDPTAAYDLVGEHASAQVLFHLGEPVSAAGDQVIRVKATAHATGVAAPAEYAGILSPVGYPGIPRTMFFHPASARVSLVDVTTAPELKVGYILGTGDEVPLYLNNLGVKAEPIFALKDLAAATLVKYDAVVLGVRAYAAHPELAGKGSAALLEYARNGGVVIVQYETAKYGDAEAPYPISVPGDSAHNVVVEARPVTVLAADAALLNWPNKITAADFHGWVAEYGHGFAASWAPEYQPLIEVHDPEQDPQKGGLLVAKVGKGAYVYCALALYRQLPEGVPGAYRLMANLLSYGKNPGR